MSVNTIHGVSNADALGAPPNLPVDKRPTILVVDDRAINRDFLVSLLNYSGYQAVEASSPTELPDVDHLDLIITDVHMPGMNGLDFLTALRADEVTRHVPVILYTATYKSPDIETKAKTLGAFAVLNKPTEPEVILEYVRAALNSNSQGSTATSPEAKRAVRDTGTAAPRQAHLGYRSATLIEIMLDLGAERDLEQLVRTFCHGAKELINAREASVHIVAPSENESHLFFSTSTSCGHSDTLSLRTCDCGLISLVKEAEGRCLQNVRSAEPGVVLPPHARGSRVLYVPIATSTNHFGCLCVVDKIDGRDFSDEDQRLVSTLTTKLGLVYENIRFYDEIQQFAARLAVEIEDRKRAQHDLELSRQEQLRLKDEFLSHVSHELRSPVMVVQQFLEILLEGSAAEISGQQREHLSIALQNTNQLDVMIGDLLEATRIETGKLRVDLRSMVLLDVLNEAVSSVKPIAQRKRIAVALEVPVRLPLVIADPSRVRQILTNLLDNAIKFTSESGTVTVRAGLDQEDPDFVRIQVGDTGCGMSPGETAKVFDRLYQVPNADRAARKGLGLGLCICKQLVTLQGGNIQVKSQAGAGSIFFFTLPVFSVATLVAPILGEDIVPESMVMLTVTFDDRAELGGKQVLASLRETVARCVLPGLDVVLPDTYATRNGQMVLLLARTDERGARVLARRLEDQLKLNPHVAKASSPPLVWYSIVDLSAAREPLTLSEQRAVAVVRIEENLKTIIFDRS
jgi:signal transduction histidine kinase/CheY-like chemotaxis protein